MRVSSGCSRNAPCASCPRLTATLFSARAAAWTEPLGDRVNFVHVFSKLFARLLSAQFLAFFVFHEVNVGSVVAQEETKTTVASADCATSTTWMPGEVNLSLCKQGQLPCSGKQGKEKGKGITSEHPSQSSTEFSTQASQPVVLQSHPSPYCLVFTAHNSDLARVGSEFQRLSPRFPSWIRARLGVGSGMHRVKGGPARIRARRVVTEAAAGGPSTYSCS